MPLLELDSKLFVPSMSPMPAALLHDNDAHPHAFDTNVPFLAAWPSPQLPWLHFQHQASQPAHSVSAYA